LTYTQWLAAVAQLRAAPDAASQAQFLTTAGAQANILQKIYAAGYSPAYFANPDYLQLLYAYLDYSAQSPQGEAGTFTGDPAVDMAGDTLAQKMVAAGWIVWTPPQQGGGDSGGTAGEWIIANLPPPPGGLAVTQIQPYDIGYPGNYVNPSLWTFDPFYGAVTPASNVKQSKGWIIVDALSQALPLLLSAPLIAPLGAALGADLGLTQTLGASIVKGVGTGTIFNAPSPNALLGSAVQIAGGVSVPSGVSDANDFFAQFAPNTTGASTVDDSDFLQLADQTINNAPGIDLGASNTFGGDLTSAFYTDTTADIDVFSGNPTVDNLLNPTDPTLYDDGAGVLPGTATGVNTVGDSANLTDESGSASNNNGNAPKGGGAQLGNGTGGGAVGPSTANTPNNTAPVSYLPPNPRTLQTAAQALYNPQGGGLYPITNPSANTGSASPYGSAGVTSPPSNSTVSSSGISNPTLSGMLQNPLVLIGMAAVAVIFMMK
jgi:hypothetical protein